MKIINPYREQNVFCRGSLSCLQLDKVAVDIIDSMQGHEAERIIFNRVFTHQRPKPYDSVQDLLRLNMTSSRSWNIFMLVCDTSALKQSASFHQR